jgi:hypothetical protein
MTMETAETWVSTVGDLLLIGGILLAPLTIFRPLRRFAGTALMTISYVFGAVLWIICAISVYAAWGGAVLIVGILFFGVGPFLIAPVLYFVHADWGNLAAFFILIALVWIARLGGLHARLKAG